MQGRSCNTLVFGSFCWTTEKIPRKKFKARARRTISQAGRCQFQTFDSKSHVNGPMAALMLFSAKQIRLYLQRNKVAFLFVAMCHFAHRNVYTSFCLMPGDCLGVSCKRLRYASLFLFICFNLQTNWNSNQHSGAVVQPSDCRGLCCTWFQLCPPVLRTPYDSMFRVFLA